MILRHVRPKMSFYFFKSSFVFFRVFSNFLVKMLHISFSVQFSCSVTSESLRPHGLQHTRPPCPSPAPQVYSNSCPLSRWRHPTISSCRPLLLQPSVFPSIRVFSNESVLRIWWRSIGVSASSSVLPKNIQDRFPFFFFPVLFTFLLYNIVLVLPYIDMNLPWVNMCSPSWTPLPPPSLSHPSGSSQCTSPEHPVSCIEPGLVIRFTYMFQCHSPISPCPRPLPQSPKDCSIYLCLFCCLAYRVIITICLNSIYMC